MDDSDKEIDKAFGIIVCAIVCISLIIVTKGEHGIGWFIVSLILIW